MRVNLILTGIIFKGETQDEITFEGPPFNNRCLQKDREDIDRLHLADQAYIRSEDANEPVLTSWRELGELFDVLNLY